MKEYSIHGRIMSDKEENHQQMIINLYSLLKANGYHLLIETKEIKQK